MKREDLRVGMKLKSPDTDEEYEVTALGKRYLLVEVKTQHSAHEFPRRYDEVLKYEEVVKSPKKKSAKELKAKGHDGTDSCPVCTHNDKDECPLSLLMTSAQIDAAYIEKEKR